MGILNSNKDRIKELEYMAKLRHRISFVGGEIIPANVELSKEQETKAKKAGGKFHDEPKKKAKKEEPKEDDK